MAVTGELEGSENLTGRNYTVIGNWEIDCEVTVEQTAGCKVDRTDTDWERLRRR